MIEILSSRPLSLPQPDQTAALCIKSSGLHSQTTLIPLVWCGVQIWLCALPLQFLHRQAASHSLWYRISMSCCLYRNRTRERPYFNILFITWLQLLPWILLRHQVFIIHSSFHLGKKKKNVFSKKSPGWPSGPGTQEPKPTPGRPQEQIRGHRKCL